MGLKALASVTGICMIQIVVMDKVTLIVVAIAGLTICVYLWRIANTGV